MIKLTPEQRLVQDEARKFASTELEPIAEEIDNNASFPRDIIKKLADLGFLGIVIPEKYGGAELDSLSYCLIIEEISKICPSVGAILIANNALVAYPLFKYGKESQKERWLARVARGEIIGAFAITEEQEEIKTTAKEENGNYVISGKKNFVVNAEAAELFIICSSTENGIVPFLIERKNLEVIEKQDSIGMRGSGIWNLKLNGVRATEDNILGGSLGEASVSRYIIDDALAFAGLGISALSVGIGESVLEESIKYSKQRHQFGRLICEFPLVQNMIVEMNVKIVQAQLLVYSAALGSQASHMAKLASTDAAVFAGIKGIQVHGGYGYTKDYPIERFFRDANVARVWCGSSAVQKTKIARALLK